MNPTTFGQYIDAYAALPGVTDDMVAAYSDTAIDAENGTLETAAVLYIAARELADTGTLTATTFTALADLGHADIPWFVLGCAPTTGRAMREIGLRLWDGIATTARVLTRAWNSIAPRLHLPRIEQGGSVHQPEETP